MYFKSFNTMKRLILILTLLVVALFSSCSDKYTNVYYEPLVSDSLSILSPRSVAFFENYPYPKGVVPVVYCTNTIDSLTLPLRASEIFDYYSNHHPDKHAFSQRGILFVVTTSPQLIQVKVGSQFKPYAELTGITMGSNYYTIQKDVTIEAINDDFCSMTNYTVQNLKSYDELTLAQKLRANPIENKINDFIKSLGAPDNTIYSKVIVYPLLALESFIFNIISNWLIVSLIIFIALSALFVKSKELINNKTYNLSLSKKRAVDTVFYLITLLVSLPILGTLLYISSYGLEYHISLQNFNVPLINQTMSVQSSFAQTSSTMMVVVFAVLYLLSSLFSLKNILIYSTYSPDTQLFIAKNNPKKFSSIFKKESIEVDTFDNIHFEPFSHYTTRFLTKKVIIAIAVSLFALFLIPKIIVISICGYYLYTFTLNMIGFFKESKEIKNELTDEKGNFASYNYFIIGVLVLAALFICTESFFNPINNRATEPVNTNSFEPSVNIEGVYTMEYYFKDNVEKTMSAEIKTADETTGEYQMLITSDQTPKLEKLTYDSKLMKLYINGQEGEAIVKYNKDLNKTEIIFILNNNTIWKLTK